MSGYIVAEAGAATGDSAAHILLGDLVRFSDSFGVVCTFESWDGTPTGVQRGGLTFTPFTVGSDGSVTLGAPFTPTVPDLVVRTSGREPEVCRLDGDRLLYTVASFTGPDGTAPEVDATFLLGCDPSGVTVLDSTTEYWGPMNQIGADKALAGPVLIDAAGDTITTSMVTGTAPDGGYWEYLSEGVALVVRSGDVFNVDANRDVSNLTTLLVAMSSSSLLPTGPGTFRLVGEDDFAGTSSYADIVGYPAEVTASGTDPDVDRWMSLSDDAGGGLGDRQWFGAVDGSRFLTIPYVPTDGPPPIVPAAASGFSAYPAVFTMTADGWDSVFFGPADYAVDLGDLASKAPDIAAGRQVRFWERPAVNGRPLVAYVWTDGSDHLGVATFDVTPGAAPAVGLTAAPDHGDAPLDVTLRGSATGTAPLVLTWAFGDGATAVGGTVQVHAYALTGSLTATFTAGNWFGSASAAVTVDVTSPAVPPSVLPPLRVFPRDDQLGGAPRQTSTSVQFSARQGWANTYR